MAFLPFWPKNATLAHNLLAFAAFWAWTAFVLGIVGGATSKWADVMYKSPADGVSFSRGLWRECTWAVIPGRDRCTHISVSKAYPWERTVQGLYIVFWIFMLMTAIMFTAAMPAALRRGSSNALAKVAGLLSLFSGFLGLIVISVFCAYTPDGGDGVSSDNKTRHLHWSFGLFTAAWSLAVFLGPVGFAT